ncbi:MAG: LURP-one-related family protein [Candidatus Asgardarchaeia archaeon]
MKCPNCGYENPLDSKFCIQCGTRLLSRDVSSISPSPVQPTSYSNLPQASILLNPNIRMYIIHEKSWDFGWGDIFNEHGQLVGKMKRKLLSLRAEIQLLEPDNKTLVAKIVRKILSIRQTYDLLTPDGQLIARMNRKLLSLFRPSLYLDDSQGRRIYEAKGNFLGFSFKIKDMTGKVIAEVEKLDKLRDLFFGGTIFDMSDKYALRIFDPNANRLMLLGFVIAIDNSVHDKRD